MVTATTWSHPQETGTPSAGKAIIKHEFVPFISAHWKTSLANSFMCSFISENLKINQSSVRMTRRCSLCCQDARCALILKIVLRACAPPPPKNCSLLSEHKAHFSHLCNTVGRHASPLVVAAMPQLQSKQSSSALCAVLCQDRPATVLPWLTARESVSGWNKCGQSRRCVSGGCQ